MDKNSLTSKTAGAMIWNSLEKFAVQGIQFVIGIVLARILTPDAFGQIAMLIVFIGLSNVFVDSGFGKALIHKQEKSDKDYSTVFFINIIVSLICYLILFFSSPLISRFYSIPELIPLLKVLGLVIVINSFTIVQNAILTEKLDFKSIAIANLIAVIISGAIGITLALNDFGVWALVVQSLIRSLIFGIILWIKSKWIPRLIFSLSSLKTLFAYGSKLLLSGLLGVFMNNLSIILVGKFFSTRQLGFYSRGAQIADTFSLTFNSILSTVSFPALSTLQSDRERIVSAGRKILGTSSLIVFPFMVFLAIVAKSFVLVLLTDKWLSIVPVLQYLLLARAITSLIYFNGNILSASGFVKIALRVDIIKMPIEIMMIFVCIRYGINALAIGHLVISFMSFVIAATYTGKTLNYGFWDQVKDLRLIIFSVLIMTVSVYFSQLLNVTDIIKLIAGFIVALVSYFSILSLFKSEVLKELFNLTKTFISSNREGTK